MKKKFRCVNLMPKQNSFREDKEKQRKKMEESVKIYKIISSKFNK